MKFLIKQMLLPASRKLATAVGTFLGGYGLAQEQVTQIEALIPMLVGVMIDVAHSALAEKKGWKR